MATVNAEGHYWVIIPVTRNDPAGKLMTVLLLTLVQTLRERDGRSSRCRGPEATNEAVHHLIEIGHR